MKTNVYTPKAIPGQPFKGHTKISKSQARKLLESGQTFKGFIVGNRVSSFHFFGGWHLAYPVEVGTWEEMEEALNGFESYLDRELGTRAAIYLSK